MDYAIEMLGIRKEFGSFVANDNITLQVKKGEIHALLGENGAGKSTLMNVLFGLYQPEAGDIKVKGKSVKITNPNIANDLGIGMVHQHFMLVKPFTVTENIILGKEETKAGFLDAKTAAKKLSELSTKYGLAVDPDAKISRISVGMQQRVEIIKTLYRGAEIVILDEPTAVLTPQEIEELIVIMKNLVKEGKSIILITHKLKEIMEVCDRVTVIRKGKGIDTVNVVDTTEQELANLMVGREVSFETEKIAANPGKDVLMVKDLCVSDDRQVEIIKGLSLNVRAGEVLGIAGVDGNGQKELVEAITGLCVIDSGVISINGQEVQKMKTRQITETGVGHIPADRHKHGLVLDFQLTENMVLQSYYKEPYSKFGILNLSAIKMKSRELIKKYDVRSPSETTLARSLSGGNQQKAIIAREIDREPALLIASQPTRGLDVGAIEYIHSKIIEQRDNGKAVQLISFELDEIMNVSDRIAVISNGRIIAVVDPKSVTEMELGLLMAGTKLPVKEATHE